MASVRLYGGKQDPGSGPPYTHITPAADTPAAMERAALDLIYRGMATQRELAAVLGISRGALRHRLRRARRRAADPLRAVLLRHGSRVCGADYRLAWLHLIEGRSLRQIARLGLAVGTEDGRSPSALRRRMRRIRRKLERAMA